MRLIFPRNITASCLLTLFGAVLAPVANGFAQWEWQAVGIAENDFLTIVIPGPSTTFATKDEALSALQNQSTTTQVLKSFTGARRSKTGGIDYYYSAPRADLIFGGWRYNLAGNLPCPQVESEAEILECVANYYETQSCPNGVTISIPPVSSWTPSPSFPQEREGGNTSFNAPECGLSNWPVGIERRRDLSCPAGYIVWGPGPTCTNSYSVVIRSRPLECPTGSPTGNVGNPCNVATGDKSQSETDYRAPGLIFTRSYHSAALGADASLGVGWTHSYSSRILIDQGIPKILIRPSGYHESLEFGQSSSGSGTWVIASGNQWLVYLSNGDVETYTSGGELTQIANRLGQVTALSYANDPVTAKRRLASVIGAFGHRIDLSYTNDRIASLTNTGGVPTQYSYDANDNLSRVTYQGGLFREYLYEDSRFPNHLTGIFDESGSRFSTYTYDLEFPRFC